MAKAVINTRHSAEAILPAASDHREQCPRTAGTNPARGTHAFQPYPWIRHSYFLDQQDTGVTLNAADAFETWDTARVRQELRLLLQFERYDLVVLLLPTPDTHGHHKTIAALTLETVGEIEAENRPAVLGVRTATATDAYTEFSQLSGYPATRTLDPAPVWSFDRRTPLSCH